MIARRIREHAKAHDWFAVVVDFVIVVFGVFIGIEVANWNQARQDRTEESRYYRQIRDDLRADLVTMRLGQRRSRANDEAAELALQVLAGGRPAGTSPGQIARAFHRGGFLYLPFATRRTYDELISTGNLGLLGDEALKDAIMDYYTTMDELRQWDEVMRDYQQQYWTASAGVLPRTVLQASIHGTPHEISEEELRAIVADARKRPELRDLLIGMAAHQARARRDSAIAERDARALIAQIDRHLG